MDIKSLVKSRIKMKSTWLALSTLLGFVDVVILPEELQLLAPLLSVILELI